MKEMTLRAKNKEHGPTTAIVLLNWNSAEMTAECMQSLLKMTADSHEIIVVDNGSQDGSVEYLRGQFPEITIVPQERNLGFAAGCNVGTKLALEKRVEFVLLLNNDTVVDPEFLTELRRVAEEHPEAAVISPKIYFWDMPNRLWWAGGVFSLWTGIAKHRGRKDVDRGQFDRNASIDWATGCAALIRSAMFEKIGLFDESFFAYSEDLDLSLRIKKAGYEIWYAPKARLWHKEGFVCRKNVGEYLRKFLSTRNLLFVMRRHARSIQWLTFLPNFIFRHVAFYFALSLLRGDYRSAWAVMQGIWASLGTRLQYGAAMPSLGSGEGLTVPVRVCADKDS
jgi:GT2 family glycosyltransferase